MVKKISIITPCYNEQDNIEECYQRVSNLFANELKAYDYEHIFCDNNSSDNTQKMLRQLASDDSNVKVIINTRNFGPQRSVFNAVLRSSGDAVVPMLSADLQDPPEVIINFLEEWEKGIMIVAGVRKNRREFFPMSMLRKLYYFFIRRLIDFEIPSNVSSFQLIDRKVVNLIIKKQDYYPSIRGLISSTGFEASQVEFDWSQRKFGKSRLSYYNLFDEALNDIISFSIIPIRIATFSGILISLSSFLYALYSLVMVVYYQATPPPGIPTLIVSIFFFGGIQLFFLGIIGEYMAATHAQVRNQFTVVEREVIGFEDNL